MHFQKLLVWISISLLLISCFKEEEKGPFSQSARKFYLDRLANSGYDLIIMDYSQNGFENLKYTRAEIDLLRIQSNALIFLEYPLGVARENYSYWNQNWDQNGDGQPDSTAPSWLVRKRNNGSNEWIVRFWDNDWKSISTLSVQAHLIKLLEAGFDGCYFTSLDCWTEFSDIQGSDELLKSYLIETIDSVRRRFPWLLFIVQNVGSLSRFPDLVSITDGVVQTEFCFGYNGQDGVLVPEERRNQLRSYLAPFQLNGKFIGIVDFPFYLSNNRVIFDNLVMSYIQQGMQIASSYEFRYYPAVRQLNDLTIIPGNEPNQNPIPIRFLSNVQEFCIQLRPSLY